MSNRTAKFALAVAAGALAGAALVGVSSNTAQAQDSCLSAPKGTAPVGSHWFYRLDHATKQHCWYLRDAKQARATTTQQDAAAAPDAAPSQDDAPPPQADAATRQSIADAHAELQPSQTPIPPRTNAANGAQPAAVGAAPAAAAVNAPATNALPAPPPTANAASSLIASRWLDPASTASQAGSQQASSPQPGSPQLAAASDTTSPSNPEPVIASDPVPVPTALPLAAADASSAPLFTPLQTMLMIMIGALAFAGLAGSIIFRFGSASARSYAAPGTRRDIWDAYDELPERPAFPTAAVRRPNIGIPREIQDELFQASRDDDDATEEPDDRIAHMLAQLARTSTAART